MKSVSCSLAPVYIDLVNIYVVANPTVKQQSTPSSERGYSAPSGVSQVQDTGHQKYAACGLSAIIWLCCASRYSQAVAPRTPCWVREAPASCQHELHPCVTLFCSLWGPPWFLATELAKCFDPGGFKQHDDPSNDAEVQKAAEFAVSEVRALSYCRRHTLVGCGSVYDWACPTLMKIMFWCRSARI